MSRTRRAAGALWAGLVALICTCALGPTQSGGGGGSETNGIIYATDLQLAPNARVVLVETDNVPTFAGTGTGGDTLLTDSLGRYSLSALASGTYNLFAFKDGHTAYRAGLTLPLVSRGDTPRDTLAAPGSLAGVVRLMPWDDSRKAVVLVLGSLYWTAPVDSVGNFVLGDLPPGSYSVRFATWLDDYGVLDTTLEVHSGLADTLADTIRLPYQGEMPLRITDVHYDTLRQITTLSWEAPDTLGIIGYNVCRSQEGTAVETDMPLNSVEPVTTTTYVDSCPPQGTVCYYHIKPVGKDGEVLGTGAVSGPVHIATAFPLVRRIADSATFTAPRAFAVVGSRLCVLDGDKGRPGADGDRLMILDTLGTVLDRTGKTDAQTLSTTHNVDALGDTLYVSSENDGWSVKRCTASCEPAGTIPCDWATCITDIAVLSPDSIVLVDTVHSVLLVDSTGRRIDTLGFSLNGLPQLATDDQRLFVIGTNGFEIIRLEGMVSEGLRYFDTPIRQDSVVFGAYNHSVCGDGDSLIFAGVWHALNNNAVCVYSLSGALVARFRLPLSSDDPVRGRDLCMSGTHVWVLTERHGLLRYDCGVLY